jgi:hypothetical protein
MLILFEEFEKSKDRLFSSFNTASVSESLRRAQHTLNCSNPSFPGNAAVVSLFQRAVALTYVGVQRATNIFSATLPLHALCPRESL